MRGSREVLPRTGGRAEHRRGERAGERTGVPFPAQRQGADTRERRGGHPQGQIGRSIGGSIENLITMRILILNKIVLEYVHSLSIADKTETKGFCNSITQLLQDSRKVELGYSRNKRITQSIKSEEYRFENRGLEE